MRVQRTYPTQWQRKILWSALTALAIALFFVLAVIIIIGAGRVLGYLQPILIPVAVAGIMAYLLNPLVDKLVKRGIKRIPAVLYVFAPVILALTAIGFWVIPQLYDQSLEFAKRFPDLVTRGKGLIMGFIEQFQVRYADNPYVLQATEWLQHQIPLLPPKIWNFVSGGLQGFLGAFGFLLGLIVVPIYLFFFLVNAGPISERWSDYLPLRASPFKDEVVSCLKEINDYLIAFFRGQIIVTIIDGTILGTALFVMGLNFALLIGIMVAVLQLIPYIGVFLCWIPAVLIAWAQFQDWKHPLIVTIIFFVVTNLDGLLIAPRIVGNSVGLHPMTIIISVFAWSMLVGGLLGALLAVPLTATLKVLLKRYVWDRQLNSPLKGDPDPPPPPPGPPGLSPQPS